MSPHVECMSSQLDLFTNIPVQTNILKTEEICYKPVTSLSNNSVIEFQSLGHGDTYRDLSSAYLRLLVKVKKSPTEDYPAGTPAELNADGSVKKAATPGGGGYVVNNLLHSLFKQCTIYLNGVAISQSDNNYAYRAYLETVLNYDERAQHIINHGFILDTAGKMNFDKATENEGLQKRKKIFEGSNVVELIGKIHGDMLNQNKLLMGNVELRIVLSREKEQFYMLEKDADTSFVQILDANLFMNHVTLNPGILIAHEQALAKRNAIYNYKRVEIKSFTIGSQKSSFSLTQINNSQIPNFLCFCMVSNAAYTGKRSENPFWLRNYDISNFYLTINGVQFPTQPLMFNYENPDHPISTRAYSNLFKNVGIHYHNHGTLIKKDFFDKSNFLLCFDLSNDASFSDHCLNLLNQGTVIAELRFAKPLPHTITCLCYAEYDSCIEIDSSRQIIRTL